MPIAGSRLHHYFHFINIDSRRKKLIDKGGNWEVEGWKRLEALRTGLGCRQVDLWLSAGGGILLGGE